MQKKRGKQQEEEVLVCGRGACENPVGLSLYEGHMEII